MKNVMWAASYASL